LDVATFHSLLRGLCNSLVRAGFRRILILNGHGGNIAALTAIADELGAELEVPIAATTYWLLAREAFAGILERQRKVRHACEAETSMMLALVPELVDMTRAINAVGPTGPELTDLVGPEVVRYRSFAARTHHGAIGDPRAANSEKGERLLDAAAAAVAAVAVNDGFWALPA
jgi:creatinine amidohydrolase